MKKEETLIKYYIFGLFLLILLSIIIWLCGCSFGLKEFRTKDIVEDVVYCDINPDIFSVK
ncbi:hypothetical protein [Candidatus Endomicrobiellum devescovinae]|jgi:hypothetical protein|uniref:hypothetical protein n=1 Tax=Candidatus Endomicrobiellum devescovinae TaxID=3242322 RepID=UPI002823276E|nr:hypothetical protein [Endomicrobium sp.]